MCFSATASFASAALTAAIGALTLTRVRSPREAPLAATPLLFAVQQGLEGFIWLGLPAASGPAASSGLVLGFLLFAQAFWPTYAPLAAYLVETDRRRRRLIAPFLMLGPAISLYLAWRLLQSHPTASAVGGHIVYATAQPPSTAPPLAYLSVVSLPLLLSSRPTLAAFGALVLAGCVVAWHAYWQAFQSVWCYFAAAGSAMLLAHFQVARRRAQALA